MNNYRNITVSDTLNAKNMSQEDLLSWIKGGAVALYGDNDGPILKLSEKQVERLLSKEREKWFQSRFNETFQPRILEYVTNMEEWLTQFPDEASQFSMEEISKLLEVFHNHHEIGNYSTVKKGPLATKLNFPVEASIAFYSNSREQYIRYDMEQCVYDVFDKLFIEIRNKVSVKLTAIAAYQGSKLNATFDERLPEIQAILERAPSRIIDEGGTSILYTSIKDSLEKRGSHAIDQFQKIAQTIIESDGRNLRPLENERIQELAEKVTDVKDFCNFLKSHSSYWWSANSCGSDVFRAVKFLTPLIEKAEVAKT